MSWPDLFLWLAIFLCLGIAAILIWRTKVQANFTLTFVIAPAPPPPIQAADLTFPGTVGTAEAGSMQLSGGTPPYSVAVADPTTLPPGVGIDAQGNVSGTPTQAGTFSVPVVVTDAGA